MKQFLFDIEGYDVRVELSATFNPKKMHLGEDARDLGLFFTYIGAACSNEQECIFENDAYCIRRFVAPFPNEWRTNYAPGFWLPEKDGIWVGEKGNIYLKDSMIRLTGLKISYVVSEWVVQLNSSLMIFVNDEFQKEIFLNQEGVFEEIIDVSSVGKDKKEYLDNAQRILKILLSDFDRVCTKYNLKYYLICGSLLGIIRHGDLIPWDDDVDVAMPRSDFNILLEHVAEEWGENKDIVFVNYNNFGKNVFLDYMTRIIYMKEEIPVGAYKKIAGKGRNDIVNHMPLDIYVLDNAADNELLHKFQTGCITFLYGLAIGHRAYFNPDDYNNRNIRTQRIVKLLSCVGKHIPLKLIWGCYEWIRKWNKDKDTESYFESNGFIYCIPWKFKKKWFGEGVRRFLGDDFSVSIPQDYDEFLKKHYGDYMQYPPMEYRKPTHSVDASGIF